jgi:hypothetical protein
VSKIRKQHALAVDILAKLGRGVDTISLEAEGNGYYVYCAWNTLIVEHNGSRTVKRGKIRILPGDRRFLRDFTSITSSRRRSKPFK